MKKLWVYWLAIAVPFVAAIFVGLSPLSLRTDLQNLVFDSYQRLSPRIYNPDSPVRIIDVDDESLKRVGQWPWPRSTLASIVNSLKSHGALVIAFDIVFSEADQMRVADLIRDKTREEALKLIAEELAKSGNYDETFANSFDDGHVILGATLLDDTQGADAPARKPADISDSGCGGTNTPPQQHLPIKIGFSCAGDNPLLFLHNFPIANPPLKILSDHAAGVGATNWVPGHDRVLRQVPVLLGFGKEIVPGLAMEALRLAQEEGASYVIKSSNASGETAFGAQTGVVAIRVGGLTVDTQPQGDVRLRFTKHNQARFTPAYKMLNNEVDPAEFDNKIVFIGSSAAGLGDLVTTPLDPSVPGVEIHAQLVERILDQDSLVRPDIAEGVEMLATVVLSLLIAFTLPFVSSLVGAVVGALGIAGMIGGSWWAFIEKGVLIDPVFPSLSAGAVLLAGVIALYGIKQSQERFVRDAFGRYVSPAVVKQLAENPDRLILGGENRELTVLFCDLRSFTTLSESFDAHGLTHFLNEYLSPLTDVAIERSGTIDKYIGDAIMAFWNAPLDDPNHARNAALTSLAMRGELAKLNERWQENARAENRSFPIVRFGVGLNTGICCVGNLGSALKFNYSCIGDDVNIASRLEGATKFFGIDIAANQTTRDEAPDLAWLEIDQVLVKGKTVPIGVHALVGDEAFAKTPEFERLAQAHAAMLSTFRERKFDEARHHAHDADAAATPQIKGLYAFYAARIDEAITEPPGEDWSPNTKLDEK